MTTFEERYDAERQITAIVFGYANALDTGDMETMAELFKHGQIRVDGREGGYVGSEGVVGMFRDNNRWYDGIPATKHVTTNLVIEVDDDGRHAASRSYFTVLQQTDELPLQIVIAGRYHDRFERRDGRWVLTDRLEFCDLIGNLSAHLTFNPFGKDE